MGNFHGATEETTLHLYIDLNQTLSALFSQPTFLPEKYKRMCRIHTFASAFSCRNSSNDTAMMLLGVQITFTIPYKTPQLPLHFVLWKHTQCDVLTPSQSIQLIQDTTCIMIPNLRLNNFWFLFYILPGSPNPWKNYFNHLLFLTFSVPQFVAGSSGGTK